MTTDVIEIDRDDGCGHTCGELLVLAQSASLLIDATGELMLTWRMDAGSVAWPLFQAQNYLDGFIEHHPSVEVPNVSDGIRANATAILARADFDRGNS